MHTISLDKGQELAQAMRAAGYGATQVQAEGKSGPVQVIDAVVPRRQVKGLLRLVNEIDDDSFVTIEEARKVMRGYLRAIK